MLSLTRYGWTLLFCEITWPDEETDNVAMSSRQAMAAMLAVATIDRTREMVQLYAKIFIMHIIIICKVVPSTSFNPNVLSQDISYHHSGEFLLTQVL